jgi:hypothetical protein
MPLESDESIDSSVDTTDEIPVTDPVTDVTPEEGAVVDAAPAEPVKEQDEPPATMEESIARKMKEINERAKAVDDPNRNPDGTLKKGNQLRKAAKPADPAAAVTDPAAPVTPPAALDPSHEKPPTSLKGNIQAKWATLDPEVKAEFHRRENDFHAGLQKYKQDEPYTNIGKTLHHEFAPYEALIRASNTTPQALIKNWMNMEYQLKMGTSEEKAGLFLKAAETYKIDPAHLKAALERVSAGQSALPQVDPTVAQLKTEVQQLKEHLEKEKSAGAQIEFTKIQTELNEFAKNRPHFEAVRHDMSALLEAGRAKDLQDAYDKATWANAEVRAHLIAEQRSAEQKQAAEKAAAAKKAAGTNVARRGSPPVNKAANAGSGTMEESIRAKLREIKDREAV